MLKPGHVVDMYDDADGTLLKDGLLGKFAELKITPASELPKVPDRDFALVVLTKEGEKHRKYPMHTPDSLAISTHYFEKVGAQLPADAQVIAATNLWQGHLKFGAEPPPFLTQRRNYGVEGNLFSEADVDLWEEEKKAEPEVFAMAKTLLSGAKLEAFPMDDLEAAQASVEEFKKCAGQLPGRDRIVAAFNLNRKLGEFGKKDDFLTKISSCERNPAFAAHIQSRREAILDDQDRSTLDEIEKLADRLPGPLLGAALERFDMDSGLHRYWERRIRNPWDSCYVLKEASVKVGDKTITKKALVGLLDSGKLASLFNESTIKEFKKQPLEVFQSLPDPTKQTISNLIE